MLADRPTSTRKTRLRTPATKSQLGLLLILLAFAALATTYNLTIPPYENLDELEHAEVVRHIAVTGKLPVHDIAEQQGFHVRQEASQPPLYHILAAGWAKLLRLPTTPHRPERVPDSRIACGMTGTLYNKMSWVRDPYGAEASWGGAILTIHALRAFSTLLQALTVIGTWALVRRAFPRGPAPLLATAIVAFNPQFLLLAAGVNNDNVIVPLATWGLLVGYDMWSRPLRWSRTIGFGLLAGLAALSKLSGLAVLGIGGLALLIKAFQKRSPLRANLPHILVMCLIAGTLLTPWLVRNVRLYGDPTALAPMLAKVGRRTFPLRLGEARLLILSYWGQLPCTFYPRALYWPYLALMIGGALGMLRIWKGLGERQRILLSLCIVWFTVITAAWVRWDLLTPAPGGRLLFPAAAALATVLGVGWVGWAPKAARNWAAALPVWTIIVFLAGPLMTVAPPSLISRGVAGEAAAFGDPIVLRDYQVAITQAPGACLLNSDVFCGSVLDLDAVWHLQQVTDQDLTMVIQLVSTEPGATDLRLNYNYWPGRGNLPTSNWPTEVSIHDHYRIPLPEANFETQAWRVAVAYVQPHDQQRLPVSVNGNVVGTSFPLDLVRVEGTQPSTSDTPALVPAVSFSTEQVENAIRLTSARTTRNDDGTWTVILIWESVRQVEVEAITFVHAYNASGELIAGADGPPRMGSFPTHLWQPGDLIRSEHILELARDAGPHQIAVGLYLPELEARLRAEQGTTPLPNNAAVLWEAENP